MKITRSGLSWPERREEHGAKRDCAPRSVGFMAGVNAYRLSDREADPLPLAIDTDWVFPWTATSIYAARIILGVEERPGVAVGAGFA